MTIATLDEPTTLDELIEHLDGMDVFFEIVKRTKMDPSQRFKAKIVEFAPEHRTWENVEGIARAGDPFLALKGAYLRFQAEKLTREGRQWSR
jgi:hypothetical protein